MSPLPADVGATPADGLGDDRALLAAIALGLRPNPARLLGPMTRILVWNAAGSMIFGSPDHLPPERRSLLWMLLVDPGGERDLWDRVRRMLCDRCRSVGDAAVIDSTSSWAS